MTQMGKYTEKRFFAVLRGMFLPIAVVIVILMFFTGVSNIQSSSGDEGMRQLEESIRRTAAACYDSEGIYPPTVEYMEEKYGLQIDKDRYYVDYNIFASNIMPDFTVLDISGMSDGSEGR